MIDKDFELHCENFLENQKPKPSELALKLQKIFENATLEACIQHLNAGKSLVVMDNGIQKEIFPDSDYAKKLQIKYAARKLAEKLKTPEAQASLKTAIEQTQKTLERYKNNDKY